MRHEDLIIFYLQLAILAVVALVCGQIARKLKQPAVLGELIGGVILGPTILGSLAPESYAHIFTESSNAAIARDAIVKLGLLFFLFVAGMEMNFLNFRSQTRSILGASVLGILIPFVVGFSAVCFFPSFWGTYSNQHLSTFAIFLATALSISALPVIARILMDINLLKTKLGTTIMASAALNDLVGWALFAFILQNHIHGQGSGGLPLINLLSVLGVFIFTITLGRTWAQRFLAFLRPRMPWPSGFIGISAICVYIGAVLAEALGVHAIFGAFLVGIAFAPTFHERDETHEVIYQFVTSFFAAPIYFVSVGLKVNFIANFDWALVLIVFFIACLGKVIGATLGAFLGKMTLRESLAVGFAMNARGAMEIVLAAVALEYHLIDERMFVALFIMAVGTSMLSGPIIKKFLQKSDYALN